MLYWIISIMQRYCNFSLLKKIRNKETNQNSTCFLVFLSLQKKMSSLAAPVPLFQFFSDQHITKITVVSITDDLHIVSL